MPTARPWTLDDPKPLVQLEDNLWVADGAIDGMPLRRKMVVARLTNGQLLIHNALCLDDDQMALLDALGPVGFIVVPNAWHRLDAGAWAQRYPNAKVVCPTQASKRVSELVRVDGDYASLPQDPSVQLLPLDGCKAGEGVLIVRSAGRVSLAFGDAVMNNPHGTGFWWRMYRLTDSTGGPRVTRLFKWAAVSDKATMRAHLLRLAELPGLYRVLPCHGDTLEDQAVGPGLRRAAACL